MKKKKASSESTRKNEVFSVSFRSDELAEVEEYLKDFKADKGLKLSRNQLIRKATLAIVRHDKNKNKSIEEHFKAV